jgi:hypothetical protein
METNKATIVRIRPISWKVCVQGEESAGYVRTKLCRLGITCSEPFRLPDLQDPPVFAFIATPKEETPLTALELQSIFDEDERIEVAFGD